MKENRCEHHRIVARSRSEPLRCRLFKCFPRLLGLVLVVCSLWLTIEDRWGSNFSVPTRYTGDAHYILGMMKLAKEGDLGLFTHITTKSLGAPFIGQLNDFPEAERAIVWLGGQIARVVGIMPASNIMLLLSCIVAAFSFYAAARLWKIAPLAAWVFAIVYAFLPHNQRSLDSLGIIFTGLLPIQLYCCWYIATVQKISWRSVRFRLTCAIALFSGILNIYWVFFFINIYFISCACRILKRRGSLIISLIPAVGTCLVAAAILGSFISYRLSYGENKAALFRAYSDVEHASLKPIELFIPRWGTHMGVLSGFFSRYYDGGKIDIGEYWWGVYMGMLPVLGLLFLIFKGIQRQLNKRAPSLPFLAACWVIAYASFGGIHAMLSFTLNFYDIRATSRYFVAVATIGLLYFVFLIHRITRRWSFSSRLLVLLPVVTIAILDQSFSSIFYPRYNVPTNVIKERMMADRDLALELESRLEAGSMIYILPVLDFPEPFSGRGGYKVNFFIYDPIRPFLYSSKLRYSYGSNKGRQGADWQLDVQELPPKEMATRLEAYGFSGILFNRKDYADGGERFLAELAEAGWPIEFEQGIRNEWVFIRLTPSSSPELPTTTPYAISVKK